MVPFSEKYTHKGCWKDAGKDQERTVPTIEGHDDSLVDDYKTRANPIEKCYLVAKKQGYSMFGVQHGGRCLAGNDQVNYREHGQSYDCDQGEGGNWANDIYVIEKGSFTILCD